MKRMKTRTDYYDEIRRGALMIVGALIGLFELGQEKPAEGEAVGKEDQEKKRVEKATHYTKPPLYAKLNNISKY